MNFIDHLNPQQRQSVTAGNGPVLVLAGPGSGKTRVLTQRIAYLIAYEGVRPYQILAVTFTNKAAREMETRVKELLGEEATRGMMLGTFHSTCARILRREAESLPLESNFVIYDSDDQERLVKSIIREANLNEKNYRPASIHASISNAKNELILPDDYPAATYRDEVVKRVYIEYQKRLIASNAVDFDDLLVYTARLLEDNPTVREKYAQRFKHVLVDEFQDTNLAQYTLIKHLASGHHNIFVVGDPDQCLPGDTAIRTPEGERNIESLREGDLVLASSGRGSTLPARINHVGKRYFDGELVAVTTQSGQFFRATPNHIVFARLGLLAGLHYVYLIYRKEKGYHIGIASHTHGNGNSATMQAGQKDHSNLEKAEKLWVLKVCYSREEARYWESLYSSQYDIPTTGMQVRERGMSISRESANRYLGENDTHPNIQRLFDDLGINPAYPHYISQRASRNLVNLRLFGDGRLTKESAWHAHRVDFWSKETPLAEKLEKRGYNPHLRGRNSWQVCINRLQYEDIHDLAKKISKAADDAELMVGAFLVDKGNALTAPRYSLMPASQLHPSMMVAVEKNGRIVEDIITEVRREPYHGSVYDFEVENLHNYLAGRIVVHNSIYRWRGADWRNVQRFEQDYPDTQVILLEQNYRSKQTILDAAMSVIDRAQNRRKKHLFTERGQGEKVFYYEAPDDYAEASFVVDTITQLVAGKQFEPGACAIMYRTNAQSRLLEEAFLQARLPYRLVGAQRFYGRREVKDMIAYLRLTYNANDEASLNRIINVPARGIGEKTLSTLHLVASQNGLSAGAVLLDLARGSASPYWEHFSARAAAPLADFAVMLANWRAVFPIATITELFDRITADIGYQQYLDDGSDEGKDRLENVAELRRLTQEYAERTMEEFLQDVALISDQDTITDRNVPTLLTLHAAKGLEFGAVFIVGLDDGILPHSRSFDEPEEMEEERRLFYVGITRAKDRLYLVRSVQRGGRGYAEETYPSRFLDDIPTELLVGKSRSGRGLRGGAPETHWNASKQSFPSNPTASPARIIQAKYHAGTRVRHPQWGEGIVLDNRIQDGDEIVDVVFESVGIKRLASSLANLVIL